MEYKGKKYTPLKKNEDKIYPYLKKKADKIKEKKEVKKEDYENFIRGINKDLLKYNETKDENIFTKIKNKIVRGNKYLRDNKTITKVLKFISPFIPLNIEPVKNIVDYLGYGREKLKIKKKGKKETKKFTDYKVHNQGLIKTEFGTQS